MTTRQEAINLKCKECAYDELDDGTWRQKVERCEITDWPLWKYKPEKSLKSILCGSFCSRTAPLWSGICGMLG